MRDIDELLSDPEFINTKMYECYKEMVDVGAYPTVRDAMIDQVGYFQQAQNEFLLEARDCITTEISRAMEADRKSKGKKFPPLENLAYCIHNRDFYGITDDQWDMLGDFLSGRHRGKQGEKYDQSFNDKLHIDRLSLFEELLVKDTAISEAQANLAEKEKIDVRTLQRSITKGKLKREGKEFFQTLTSELAKLHKLIDGDT